MSTPGPMPSRTVNVEILRELALSWRWWGRHQCGGATLEAATWRRLAEELEHACELPAPTPEDVENWGSVS